MGESIAKLFFQPYIRILPVGMTPLEKESGRILLISALAFAFGIFGVLSAFSNVVLFAFSSAIGPIQIPLLGGILWVLRDNGQASSEIRAELQRMNRKQEEEQVRAR